LWFAFECAQMTHAFDTPKDALAHFLFVHAGYEVDGYVYLLRSGTHYKIGKSKDVNRRLTQISPKTPLPVELVHTIPTDNMAWAEHTLHEQYASFRTNGEWFALPEHAVRWIVSTTKLCQKDG
jgi:hypothetical protein